MTYSYRDDLTFADIAFDVEASTAEELLSLSVDAMLQLMIDPLEALEKKVKKEVIFHSEESSLESAISDLLYELLQKVIFYKDAEGLFLRVEHLSISPQVGVLSGVGSGFDLRVTLSGESIQPNRHPLGTDVKGVTFHKYDVSRGLRGWKATVVVDT